MRLRAFLFMLAAQLIWAASALGQRGYKTEAISAPPSDLPKTLLAAVQLQGTRVLNDQGVVVCEVWWRKAIPSKPIASASSDIIYGNVGEGTLVGVLRFPNGGSDFRGQAIKPGLYTLRYALIPQDGNHMGVSSYRDFLLLGPAAQDTAPDQTLKFDDLVKLSRLASATPHPAVLSLDPVNQAASQSFPAVVRDEQGHWALHVKLHAKDATGGQEHDFPLVLIVLGKAEA